MRYDVMAMSEKQKIVSLGQLPQKELDKLTQADKTVLATALIYSLSELIATNYGLDEEVDLPTIVQEAALFAIELTDGVKLVTNFNPDYNSTTKLH